MQDPPDWGTEAVSAQQWGVVFASSSGEEEKRFVFFEEFGRLEEREFGLTLRQLQQADQVGQTSLLLCNIHN